MNSSCRNVGTEIDFGRNIRTRTMFNQALKRWKFNCRTVETDIFVLGCKSGNNRDYYIFFNKAFFALSNLNHLQWYCPGRKLARIFGQCVNQMEVLLFNSNVK